MIATIARFAQVSSVSTVIVVLGICWSAATETFANDWKETVEPFLKQHCHACHDARQARAGFRIDQLGADFLQGDTADAWLEVMDHINLGTMPPDDKPRPDAETSFAVVKWIAGQLQQAKKTAQQAGGRIPMRRLNRDEFGNTIRDLLLIDEKHLRPIIDNMPGDGKAEGFDRLGAALFFDQTQIASSLAAAEQVSALAIVNPADGPPVQVSRFEAEKPLGAGMGIRTPSKTTRNRFSSTRKEVAAGPLRYRYEKEGVLFMAGKGSNRDDFEFSRVASTSIDELVTEDGYYRIRVRCGMNRGTRGDPIVMAVAYNYGTPQEQIQEVKVTPTLSEPGIVETVMFIHRGADDQRRRITLLYNDLPKYTVSTDETEQFFRDSRAFPQALREARDSGDKAAIEQAEANVKAFLAKADAWKGPTQELNPKYVGDTPPQLYLDWMEFEGPLHDQWPPASHKQLLFDGDERRDAKYAREIFARIMPRAYRRPVEPREIDSVMRLFESEFAASRDFYAALRIGLQRVLASSGFLFLQEPSGDATKPRLLNDYELASRLSYFLWSSMPDEELFQLAAAGRLRDAKVLSAQVDRMLADSRSREFVENFGGQWLSVPEFGSVTPAPEYRDYDEQLEQASKLEVYAFVEEVLREDLSIGNFLDSDFVVINERLARHYGIEGVVGEDFRRVPITAKHHRGGVLGMAGLMTLLADGTRTLPVRRAAWVVSNLFNDPPPPPPPNAGEVQPNTAGENLTVRERLERHRNEPTCASCHRTLDPYGLALENYDAIGKWRTQQNGEGIRGRNAPQLNVSGTLPSGRSFATLQEFKSALRQEQDRFARAFSERLLNYALCRPIGYTDRDTVDDLVQNLRENDYRFQRLIHAVVASQLFQTK